MACSPAPWPTVDAVLSSPALPHLKPPVTHSGHLIPRLQNQFQLSSEKSSIQGLHLESLLYQSCQQVSTFFLPPKFFLGSLPWTPVSLKRWHPSSSSQCHTWSPSAQTTPLPIQQGLPPPSPNHPLQFLPQLLLSLGPLAPLHYVKLSLDPWGTLFGLLDLPLCNTALKPDSSMGKPGLGILNLSRNRNHLRKLFNMRIPAPFQRSWFNRPGMGSGNFSQVPWGILIQVAMQGPCFVKHWSGPRSHAVRPHPTEVHAPGFQSKKHPWNRFGHWNTKNPVCLEPKSFSDTKLGSWGRTRADFQNRHALTWYNFRHFKR